MSITTSALAQSLGLQPQTLRAAVCRQGSYFGITPVRLLNGRLLWPSDSFERLTSPVMCKSGAANADDAASVRVSSAPRL